MTGTVTFTPSTTVYAAGQPLVSPASPVQCQIIGGQLKTPSGAPVQLLSQGSSGLTIEGRTGFWYWTAAIAIGGGASAATDSFSFFLAASPATVDLYSLANTGVVSSLYVPLAGGTMTGQLTTPDVAVSGLTGATAASRYAGATASGAPASGTFMAGDFVIDQTGKVWICTAGGTPGTWAAAGPTIPVTIAQGGTGQATQQAAMDALAGAQTSGQFLRGNGSHVVMGPIQASDVPQLSQYNPIGLTGATAPTSYAGGTVSGHPLSGTWSQGQWVVDQSGKIYVCVTGGTPGTWRRVGADPWQFFIEDYAKCDGKQALVTVVNGSATINTAPLAAPSAPVPTTAATGGTILAGVYGVIVTYVNRWGETVGSAAGTVTTTGSTSTITVPAPSMTNAGNATGWYAYVTQPGGSTYYRQQPASSPSALEVPLTLTAPPATSGANPPGADTSAAQVFTSTAIDGGKNAMICGAQGSPGGPAIDTIATVNSPTQAVLTTGTSTIQASQAGCAMVFSSDDRLAVDQCISDARAYAVANSNFAQVIGPAKIIGLGTGLFQSLASTGTLQYNTQVRIPVGNPSGQTEKLEIQLLMPADNAHNYFWVSQLPNLVGGTFVSYSVGPTTPDPTFGQQSVIGGPLGGAGFNGSNGFANVKAVIRGVQVVQPGFSNSIGVDLQFIAGFVLRGSSQAYAPATSTGGGVNPSNGWINNSFWQAKIGTGLRTPNEGNNDDCVIESFATEGLTIGISNQADHLVINRLSTINTYIPFRITNADQNAHDLTIHQWSFENISGGIFQNQASGTAHIKVNITMDGECLSPLYDIQDNGNNLYGTVRWSDPFRTAGGLASIIAPVVQGAANLEIINGQITRSVYDAHAYAYTLGATFQNPWWRHTTITIAGGTVTGISIGPHGATLTSLGFTSGTFRLPSGWDINIAGSVKPTTFLAVPD